MDRNEYFWLKIGSMIALTRFLEHQSIDNIELCVLNEANEEAQKLFLFADQTHTMVGGECLIQNRWGLLNYVGGKI
jgi:hypothetical protein